MLKIASFTVSREYSEYDTYGDFYKYAYRDETINVDKETAQNIVEALQELVAVNAKLSTSYKGVVGDRQKSHKSVVGNVDINLDYAHDYKVSLQTDTENHYFTVTIEEGVALVNYLKSVLAFYP